MMMSKYWIRKMWEVVTSLILSVWSLLMGSHTLNWRHQHQPCFSDVSNGMPLRVTELCLVGTLHTASVSFDCIIQTAVIVYLSSAHLTYETLKMQ
jgi:hypothetical protein